MQKRNTQQRRRSIVDALHEHGEVQVEALAKQFSISEVTIRKDLAELENSGLLLRKFGGAVPLAKEAPELVSEQTSKTKQAIASAAAQFVQDHDRIIIDSGSTTAALLHELKTRLGLVVMTNSLQVANQLLEWENEPKVLMTGGTWDTQSHSFQGQMAEQMLRAYNFDHAFIGAAGLDAEKGTTTFNELTQLSRTMAEVSRNVVIMAESEKFKRKIPNLELSWQAISALVTDEYLAPTVATKIQEYGVNLICASVK